MRYFAKTYETGSFSKAAEDLHIAQPALGLQIRQLENDLDVKLFIRHARGVSPTTAGRQLYLRANEILDLVDQARAEVCNIDANEREPVVLGLTNGVTKILGHQVLIDAQSELPRLHVSLVEEMSSVLIDAIDRGEVDVALAYDAPDRPTYRRIPLLDEEIVYVRAAKEDRDSRPISFTSILDLPLVLPNERDVIRNRMQTIADQMRLPMRIGYEVSSIAMLKRLVADGGVATVMPFASVSDEFEAGVLHIRRIIEPVPLRRLYLLHSTRRGPLVRDGDLLDLIQRELGSFATQLGDLVQLLPAFHHPISELPSELDKGVAR
ncbi:LysR family transcriptional regulator [Pararhizobium haloflavum]|uniref:LysR family transcriptional regulator n=1 Tax=Pararhizobium haloflavum TaxID=2037914 RepID=UPI000C18C6EE|nr:LysR family transcriptional regulator [Pararhizobium haloflavum]